MKNYAQIYVKSSFEAAEMYCKSFESEETVCNAFNILSNGGVIINPIHEVPWSKCCATVIDKFGVCWWIAI